MHIGQICVNKNNVEMICYPSLFLLFFNKNIKISECKNVLVRNIKYVIYILCSDTKNIYIYMVIYILDANLWKYILPTTFFH